MPNGNNKVLFGLIIRSDGFDLDCLFYKQRRVTGIKDPINSLELQLSDFNYQEVEQRYHPTFIDPGRKSVFTAARGLDIQNHTLMRCTIKEYYHYTRSTKLMAKQTKMKKERGFDQIESAIPTTKTSCQDTPNIYSTS